MGLIEEFDDTTPIHCGEAAAKHFAFANGYRNLNHGSYGTYPLEVRSVYRDYQEQSESRPDTFVRFQYRTNLLDESRKVIADYLDLPTECCVFVPNVSVGIDTTLRNLVFEPGDVVICFADIYPSYASTLDYLSSRSPLMISKIDYTHPVSDDYICQAFEDEVKKLRQQGKNPKLAMFDTISSLPGVRMPFERLTALCKDLDVMSLVDGAHGVGQIPLRIREMDPDFFVSNLHKWLYVPRGCAVLYVPERNQHLLHTTLPTGFGYGQGFVRNFSDMGTLDNSSFLCVKAALEWRKRLVWRDIKGEEAIFEYLPHLAREGGKLVAEILGTEVLENKEGTLGRCSLTNVRVPVSLREVTGGDEGVVGKIETWMMTTMTVEYETAVKFFTYDGAWWVRLSAQVYLTVADFEYVARGLKETCERVERGEWRA